jgi:uncharacterized protein with PIN domain
MLHGLGRWMRAAGYDTVIAADGLADCSIFARCDEDHILLTKEEIYLLCPVLSGALLICIHANKWDGSTRSKQAGSTIRPA